jgi:hypothetical protein
MERAREQVRRREARSGEHDKGRNRGEGDYREPDQSESRHHQEDERPHKHDRGNPFESITHVSSTFLV